MEEELQDGGEKEVASLGAAQKRAGARHPKKKNGSSKDASFVEKFFLRGAKP